MTDKICTVCNRTREEAAKQWRDLYGDEYVGIFYRPCSECGMATNLLSISTVPMEFEKVFQKEFRNILATDEIPKCAHKNSESRNGLLEDYEKCLDCGLEIPHNFPKQWNF